MAAVSASVDGNWIPDLNRFGLPKPPAWFLKAMWDMDAALVIVPSRQKPRYLLARRRERSRKVADIVTRIGKAHAQVRYLDSELLESRKLVAVDVIVGNVMGGTWNAAILADLKDRDMWAAGGADAYIAKIEGQEQEADSQRRASLLDNIEHRAADAYRSYKARTGQRNQHAKDRRSARPLKNRSFDSGSIAGSGPGTSIVITG